MRVSSFLQSGIAVLALATAASASGAQTCKDNIPKAAPDSRYTTANGTDGTVTDDRTGLTWKRCSEGQTWDGSGCTGSAADYTWQDALQRAQAVNEGSEGNNRGHSDWRLPNKNELASLVERACHSPAINATIFPGPAASGYWSASPYGNSSNAWHVDFNYGHVSNDGKGHAYGVRLVRGGSVTNKNAESKIDPKNLVKKYEFGPSVNDLSLKGDYVFLAGGNGVTVFDISNANQPQRVAEVSLANAAQSITIKEGYAYVTNDKGLVVFDMGNPSDPMKETVHYTPNKGGEIIVEDDIAYVIDSGGTLEILDISQPPNIERISTVTGGGGAWGIAKLGENLLIPSRPKWGSSDSIKVLDVSDPKEPGKTKITKGVNEDSSLVQDILVWDGKVFLLETQTYGDSYLRVLNLQDIDSPRLISSIKIPANAQSLTANAGYIYVAVNDSIFWSGVQVVNVKDPANPKKTNKIDAGPAENVKIGSALLFVATGKGAKIYSSTEDSSNKKTTFIHENLADGTYVNSSATKRWTFQNGDKAVSGLKAVRTSADDGLGLSQQERTIGDVAAGEEFTVEVPIDPRHGAGPATKRAEFKLVDGGGNAVAISNSGTDRFWLEVRTNRAPRFAERQAGSAGAAVGEAVSVPLRASDPDGDGLSYQVEGAGSIQEGAYSATFDQAGVHAVTLVASDGHAEARRQLDVVVTGEQMGQLFGDVSPDIPEYGPIHYLAREGVVIGVPGDSDGERVFSPNRTTTRAEALKMVLAAAERRGLVDLADDYRPLPNLRPEANAHRVDYTWATPYVLTAEDRGAVADADAFRPAAPVSRAWLAEVIDAVLDLEVPTHFREAEGYTLADADAFARDATYASARRTALFGYMGTLGEAFEPTREVPRKDAAEVVAAILRTPTIDGVALAGTREMELGGRTLPAVDRGDAFRIDGVEGLDAPGFSVDGSNRIVDDSDAAARVDLAAIPGGDRLSGRRRIGNLGGDPPLAVTPDDTGTRPVERRTLYLVLRDTASGARNIRRVPFAVTLPDADGDGVADDEDAFPNDPNVWADMDGDGIGDRRDDDRDGDGLPDTWEVGHGLSPADPGDAEADPDGDGWTNREEYEQGTDPTVPNADQDNDGIPDAQGSDRDGDGLPNAWEEEHGLDPDNASDATADPDGDGLTNREEYNQGTDPNQPNGEQPKQRVTTEPAEVTAVPGQDFTVGLQYTTSDGAAELGGLGLRIHFDRSRLKWQDWANVLDQAKMDQSAQPAADSDDGDSASATDRYMAVQWEARNPTWPGTIPVDLADLRFTVPADQEPGTETRIRFSTSLTASGYALAADPVTVQIRAAYTWDIDGNGQAKALEDGLLVVRYLAGFRGEALIEDLVAEGAERSGAQAVEQHLAGMAEAGALDIDGDGDARALTDGLLLVRYLFGFTGESLTEKVVADGAERTDATTLSNHMQERMPQ